MGDVNNNDLDFVEILDDEDVSKDKSKEDQSVNKSNNKEKDNNKKENLSEEEKKKVVKREVFSWIRLLAIAVAVALCINYLILFNGYVPSGSMYPTIEADGSQGARIIAFRLSYLFEEPKRGDIIIFKYPVNPAENYVKRVIGLPGETVEIIDGKVYISKDGEMLENPLYEPYLNEIPLGSYGPYTVPEDSYFVMGDNRNNSWDSRKWVDKYGNPVPFVPEENIIGKALFQYYPSIHNLLKKNNE